MDCIVHGIAKSQTGLSNFHFLKCKDTLTYEKKQRGRGKGEWRVL